MVVAIFACRNRNITLHRVSKQEYTLHFIRGGTASSETLPRIASLSLDARTTMKLRLTSRGTLTGRVWPSLPYVSYQLREVTIIRTHMSLLAQPNDSHIHTFHLYTRTVVGSVHSQEWKLQQGFHQHCPRQIGRVALDRPVQVFALVIHPRTAVCVRSPVAMMLCRHAGDVHVISFITRSSLFSVVGVMRRKDG